MRVARRRGILGHSGSAAFGLLLDLVVGEPPARLHPVAGFGRLMAALERSLYADRRLNGVVCAGTGVAVGAGVGLLVPSAAVATSTAVASRALWDLAMEVSRALGAHDLERARDLLPGLVGRDAASLDPKEMVRATVESVAENTVDAIVAPALWGALAGAPGALGYRAVNTLDSMVGHRSPRYERFGWASARLDDIAGYVPARVTAGLVVLARPRAATEVLRCVRTQAPAHPSPNAGVAEAAFAAALGLRLGGLNRYGERTELRPALGAGRAPEVHDIGRAVQLSRQVTAALVVALALVAARHRRSTP